MALQTKTRIPTTESAPSDADLVAAVQQTRQAYGQLKQVAEGSESAFERMDARQRLPERAAQVEAAELALARFREAAPGLERERQAKVMAYYDPEVKARLTAVLPVLAKAEAEMLAVQAFAQQADHELRGYGSRYALLAWSPLVGDVHTGSALSQWRQYLRDAGWFA